MKTITILLFLSLSIISYAQQPNECKLQIGTNLSGVVDYGTELPFVNLMRNARMWYTKDIDNPNAAFDSGFTDELTYRADGYPTHIPQQVAGADFEQRTVTIWANTSSWPAGEYTVLWEGTGQLSFWGGHENLTQTDDHRIVFDFLNPMDNVLEMTILTSDIDDPIRNIRLLMPGTEDTYETQPFYSLWLEKLSIFPSVRFMDWGTTNSWGQPDNWTWDDPALFAWEDRAQMDHYTWATNKGIPYEMMIRLLNDYDLDGWVCVPHRASDDYIEQMATLFRNDLEAERHLTVEYSNEIWNWIFGQTHWLNKYGCEQTGVSWPEGIVPYVQNCLDIWSGVFDGELDRLTRVAGVQASWQDVSNRMVENLTPGSYDAITPTFYFGINEEGDAALDALGASATVTDVAFYARQAMGEGSDFLLTQKNELADPMGVPMVFYEGGQHITGHPFGEEPTYGQALLDIQRDTAMYNMYIEWFDFLATLQTGEDPLQLMNFSFVAPRSSRYGSWGILETMDQDLSVTPAPKYSAILETIQACETIVATKEVEDQSTKYRLFPNPTSDFITITGNLRDGEILMYNEIGREVIRRLVNATSVVLDVSNLTSGAYFIRIAGEEGVEVLRVVVE